MHIARFQQFASRRRSIDLIGQTQIISVASRELVKAVQYQHYVAKVVKKSNSHVRRLEDCL